MKAERSFVSHSRPNSSPMDKKAPTGYRRPRGDEWVGFAYVCLTCGANVSPSAVELHAEWHRAD